MTSFPWVLLTGIITAAAALTGVWLTQRTNRRQRLEDRADARRLEQRDVLVELIDAVEHWTPLAEMTSLLLGRVGAGNELTEYLNTDSGKNLLAATRELERVLVRCRLIITDDELRPLVLRIKAELDRRAEDVNGPLVEAARSRRDSTDAVVASLRYYRDVRALAVQVQETALRRLT